MPTMLVYIGLFILGTFTGLFMILFIMGAHYNNQKFEYWDSFMEGYIQGQEDAKNENRNNGAPPTTT